MPVTDGFNVLDIMSENGINIPIVLVTAEATAANVQRAAKYSIAGFISKAAYFYDIGLMGVPSELIANADTLTGSDREIYNSHTNMGANIIRLNSSENCKFFVKVCSDICMHHHERFDGTGYPHGLRGSDNTVYSRLCGLAIRFDKLIVSRRDINEVQFDFVINEMKFDRGAFSPELIDLLAKCRSEILSYYKLLRTNNLITL